MIESLPTVLTGGLTPDGRLANRMISRTPTQIGDVDNLPQSLTIGGTDYAPTAFLVADDINPSGGAWTSRHDASKALSVAASTIPVPSGFAWSAPGFDVYGNNTAGYHTTLDWSSFKPTTATKIRYVDIATGANGDDGASWGNAWKSIAYALAQAASDSDITLIYVKAGRYSYGDALDNSNVDHDLAVVADGGTVVSSCGILASSISWTPDGTYPNVYAATRSASSFVVDHAQLTTDGNGTHLTTRASVALVAANPGSFFVDGNTVYVRTSDSRAPDVNVEIIMAVNGPRMNGSNNYYFEGFDFRGGNSAFYCNAADRGVFVNCKFRYSLTSNGLDTDGCTNIYVRDCEASENCADGFNYHTTTYVLEEDCEGYANGWGLAGSNNGSSQHDDQAIIRVGCTYRRNNGPQIADITVSDSWNIGVETSHPFGVSTWQNSGIYSEGNQWLHGCYSHDCTYDIYEAGAETTYYYNTTYSSSFGTLTAYTPTQPSPTYAIDTAIANDFAKYGASKYHVAADTTWGQVTTGDYALELVLAITANAETVLASRKRDDSTLGYWVRTAGNAIILGTGNGTTSVETSSTTTIATGHIAHVFIGVDKTEKQYICVNGVYCNSADVSAVTGNLLSTVGFGVGGYADGAAPFSGHILSVGIWNLPTSPWPGASTNQAVISALAASRFATVAGIADTKSTAYSFARACTAYADRYVSTTQRQLFPVSSGWPRVCERKDSAGETVTGYLSEPACTNEGLYSEDFSQATWEKTRLASGSNLAIAPDGTTTADTLVPSADDNTHYIEQSHASGAGQHVASFWVKREGFDWCRVTSPSTANASSYFDLRNGVVGTVGAGCTSTGIQAWGNGWYRCWIEYTGGADAHYHRLYISQADGDDTFAGDGAAVGLYVWGYQHEDDGTVIPSSYVKTTTAAVTRAKDSLTRTIPAVATGKIAVQCTALLGPSHNSTHTKTIVAVDDLG